VIIQLGSIFGAAVSGFGQLGSAVLQAALPSLVQSGQQFLVRELSRKATRREKNRVKAQAVQALNSPGIAVTRVGGTTQPVGGRVQRSTFTPAALTPAQSPFGNVPLVPVGFGPPIDVGPQTFPRSVRTGVSGIMERIMTVPTIFPAPGTRFGRPLFPALPPPPLPPPGPRLPPPPPGSRLPAIIGDPSMTNALALRPGEPRFATDQFGRTIMFVPSPRPGEGFLPIEMVRQLGLKPTRPFWRFNRAEGQFEKIKSRRMNPFNFKATKRAGRRIEATLDAVKEVVRIERKMTRGKVTLRKRRKKK